MMMSVDFLGYSFFFFQAEDGIRDDLVTGVQTCALPICLSSATISLLGAWSTIVGGQNGIGNAKLSDLVRITVGSHSGIARSKMSVLLISTLGRHSGISNAKVFDLLRTIVGGHSGISSAKVLDLLSQVIGAHSGLHAILSVSGQSRIRAGCYMIGTVFHKTASIKVSSKMATVSVSHKTAVIQVFHKSASVRISRGGLYSTETIT